jgi:hypothetical protein
VCRLTYNDDVVRQLPDQLAVFQGATRPLPEKKSARMTCLSLRQVKKLQDF